VPDPGLDLGAVLRRFGDRLGAAGGSLTAEQRQAVRDLGACRTAALGGRVEQCSACGRRAYVYHSCRNRHWTIPGPVCRPGGEKREAERCQEVEWGCRMSGS
jgi:hypothetical protein